MKLYDLTPLYAEAAPFIKALNNVDWSNHGYEADVTINTMEASGHDIFMSVLEHRLYEHDKLIYRVGTGHLKGPNGMETGNFASVLAAAGITDE